ncbi:hypothetical protein [Myroides odoratimimus]|uniref:hypothetical protein n=1 Tax=Myroides odoratimimus TaxID=76832 RepID=UPI0031017C13
MKLKLFSIIAFGTLISFTVACKDKEVEKSLTNLPTEVVNITAQEQKEESMASVDEAAVEGEEDYDDPTIYPISFKFKHDLIMTGNFHEGEIVGNVGGKLWVGLVKETDGSYGVYKLNPSVELIHDVVLDEVGEMTGNKISAKSVGEIIFMTNEGLITKGTDLAHVVLPKIIYPGESKDFSFNSKEYTLFSKGEKGAPYTYTTNEGEEVKAYEIKKYSLFLKIKGQEDVITLLDLSHLEEATPTIDFAGDLNNDGILDFLINTTYNYNMSRYTLYLSDGKQGQIKVLPVAALVSLGC